MPSRPGRDSWSGSLWRAIRANYELVSPGTKEVLGLAGILVLFFAGLGLLAVFSERWPAAFTWALRLVLLWVTWKIADGSFRGSTDFSKTARTATAWILGLACFAAFTMNTTYEGDCTPDPFGSPDCVAVQEAVTMGDRLQRGLFVALFFGAPTALAGLVTHASGGPVKPSTRPS